MKKIYYRYSRYFNSVGVIKSILQRNVWFLTFKCASTMKQLHIISIKNILRKYKIFFNYISVCYMIFSSVSIKRFLYISHSWLLHFFPFDLLNDLFLLNRLKKSQLWEDDFLLYHLSILGYFCRVHTLWL